ncbi:alpha/beta fold hydrolase [Nonomuraea sp. NPDC049784]|uniref:alpha/beta fold hydrolase n=1 Tax=Nonomuraea sp. NPDC049784 TaxID=3154361 RepID=UPI0033DFAC62
MSRRTSRLAVALVAMATLVTVPLTGAANAIVTGKDVTDAVGKRGITWGPCEEEPSVECGTLAVPVDWSNPNGRTLPLALARRKATDPSARIGSLLANPGGPGNSGVNDILRPSGFSEDIQRRFDIVGYDPRGVARSGSVTCSASVYNQMPYPVMTSQADYDKWFAFDKTLRADCRQLTGALLYDHLDSANVARDMDAIRSALGEPKLTSYGVSYGTLAQQMYAEMFPNRVRAMVLDGNMDHSLNVKQFQVTEAATVEDSFDEFADWCARDTDCVLHDRDVRALWKALLDKAGRGELYWPGESDPVSAHNLRWLGVVLNEAPVWRQEAKVLLALDGGPVPDDMGWPPGNGPVNGEFAELPTAILCEDWNLRLQDYNEYADVMRASNAVAPDMAYNPMPMGDMPICQGHPVNNPQHPLRYYGSAPLLVVTSKHDPDTPYEWSANVARQLGSKATLLTYEGWGHGVYGMTQCTTNAVDSYLISLTVPAKDATCPAEEPQG